MSFILRHHNRRYFPDKQIIICEDDLHHQMEFAQLMRTLFEPQGKVDITFTPSGAVAAKAIEIYREHLNLIILDHDMPIGNGTDLIKWMAMNSYHDIPIITASGHLPNNPHMVDLCRSLTIPVHKYTKREVLDGKANDLIKELVMSGC